jgi:lambda family phage tail tape measure protein
MAFNIPEAKIRISATASGKEKVDGLRKSIGGLSGDVQGISASFSKLKGFATAALAAFGVSKLVSFSTSVIDAGAELDDLTQKTGVSVEALAALRGAAKFGGISFEQLEGGLKKFSIGLADTSAQTNKVVQTISALGIQSVDATGKLRPTGDLIFELSKRFAELPDGAQKARAAFQIFGKSGADLIPFLNLGPAAIKEFGIQISTDFSQRAATFNDSLDLIGLSLQNNVVKALEVVLPSLQLASEALLKFFKDESFGSTTLKVFSDLFLILIGNVDTFIAVVRDALGGLVALGESTIKIFSNTAKAVQQTIQALGGFRNFKDIDLNIASGTGDIFEKLGKEAAERDRRLLERRKLLLSGLFLNGDGGRAATTPEAPRQSNLQLPVDIKDYSKENDAIEKFRRAQQSILDTRRLELESVKMSTVEYEKLVQAKKLDEAATTASANLSANSKAQIDEITESIKAQQVALIDLEQAQRESYGFGAQQAFKEYLESVKDVAAQTKQAFANAFKGFEDSLTSFITTGQFKFSEFANAIIADIIRIQVRQSIIAPIVGAIGSVFAPGAGSTAMPDGSVLPGQTVGFANGGIMTSSGPVNLRKYANGGIANSPQLALYGEGSRPEAYVPLPDGRSIPVSMDGGGSPISVTVNVSASGNMDSSGQGQDQKAGELGKLVAGAVRSELINQKRPGGLLA